MTTRLILLVHEHWPRQAALHWVLLDARGGVLQAGESAPQHWPPAAAVTVVLSGAQLTWHALDTPPGTPVVEGRALAYALEEHLLFDADSQHLTVTSRQSGAQGLTRHVLACSRARLKAVLEHLATLRIRPDAVYAELECAPAAEGRWTLSLGPQAAILRTDRTTGIALDPDPAALQDALAHVAELASAAGNPAHELVLAAAPGCRLPDLADIAGRLAMPLVISDADYRWWAVPPGASNLLHGEFRAARRGRWQAFLRPLGVAAAGLVAGWLVLLATVLDERAELAELEGDIARIFREQLPGTPAVAPLQQIARRLDDARQQQGLLTRRDFLSLMAVFAEAAGPSAVGLIARISYRPGELAVATGGAQLDPGGQIQARLAVRGYRLTADTASPNRWILRAEAAQ